MNDLKKHADDVQIYTKLFICQTPSEIQQNISSKVLLYLKCEEHITSYSKINEIMENVMCGRLCDLVPFIPLDDL